MRRYRNCGNNRQLVSLIKGTNQASLVLVIFADCLLTIGQAKGSPCRHRCGGGLVFGGALPAGVEPQKISVDTTLPRATLATEANSSL